MIELNTSKHRVSILEWGASRATGDGDRDLDPGVILVRRIPKALYEEPLVLFVGISTLCNITIVKLVQVLCASDRTQLTRH